MRGMRKREGRRNGGQWSSHKALCTWVPAAGHERSLLVLLPHPSTGGLQLAAEAFRAQEHRSTTHPAGGAVSDGAIVDVARAAAAWVGR